MLHRNAAEKNCRGHGNRDVRHLGVAINRASSEPDAANPTVSKPPIPRLIQNRLLTSQWLISSRCWMASVNPFNPKLVSNRLKVVTIATRPKSEGVNRRASTTVEII